MKLTTEQIDAIDAGEAVEVSLDETRCVVLRQDVYERLLNSKRDGIPSEVVSALIDENMDDYDADDPLLDSYQGMR